MPVDRFFHPAAFHEGEIVTLIDAEWRHLAQVMRVREGEEVELVNGRSQLAQARCRTLAKRHADLEILSVVEQAESGYRLVLAQALPRMNRLDGIVEKATELGVSELWLFPGERSERKELTANQTRRVEQICVSAMKQCGRLDLPNVKLLPRIKQWESVPSSSFFGDLAADATRFQDAFDPTADGCLFCIGPEAGLTETEEERLRELGARGVKLHQNILRTDTAPVVALSLVQHWRLS